ncbi:MAG: hypothetical protein JWN61_3232 [Pseudonocardiales bacterium]|nr:hypothetical protein [Pseudonocardiales bacterium]
MTRQPISGWLDVETTNSWEGDTISNRAVLEGMTDYFGSQHVQGGARPAMASASIGTRTVGQRRAECFVHYVRRIWTFGLLAGPEVLVVVSR